LLTHSGRDFTEVGEEESIAMKAGLIASGAQDRAERVTTILLLMQTFMLSAVVPVIVSESIVCLTH